MNFRWGALILAAGSSSRMGRPKQFLKINDESLIRKCVNEALQAGADQVFVVAGLDHELIKSELSGLALQVIVNNHSEKGMGSSIKFGVEHVIKCHPDLNGLLIMVCDQPLLTSAHLMKMISIHRETGNPIVASYYSGKNGVPVLFHSTLFENLLRIKEQQGAKSVIEQNPALVKSIDFPEGTIDIDTPADWEKFLNY